MEFQYSTLVPRASYDDESLCTGYTLRIHKDEELVDLGTLRAQEDWSRHVGPVGFYKGSLGAKFNFVSLALPECLPDRIEIIAYINEVIFLHDDIVEDVSKQRGDELNDVLVNGFLSEPTRLPQEAQSGRLKIQRKLVEKMIAIDKERALKTAGMWAEFLAAGCGRKNHTVFETLDEFMKYRVLDVGKMYWVGVLTFGMALTISDEEIDRHSQLLHPAWLSCGMVNDLYSWPKEREAAVRSRSEHVNNSIWVLMREHDIDEGEAISRLRALIKDCFSQHLRITESCKDRADLSPDLRRFMEAMSYSMVANVVWSGSCPRYNEGAGFSRRQLEWMKNGTPGYPGIMGPEPWELSTALGRL